MVQISKKETGRNISRLLEEYGMTVRDLQEELELDSPQSVYKWLNGKALPSLENLVVLSNVLNIPMEQILVMEGTEEKEVFMRRRRRILEHMPVLRAYQISGIGRLRKIDIMVHDTYTDWKPEMRLKTRKETMDRDTSGRCLNC